MNTRLTFGWDSPNEAAIFIAMLLPILWAVELAAATIRPRIWRWAALTVLVVVETGLLIGLATTASRSGVVAALCGGLVFRYLATSSDRRSLASRIRGACIQMSVRFIILLLALVATDRAARFGPDELSSDRSGEIRLDLWRAGLRMLALEPASGWGYGRSGLHYMHWFQDPDDPKRVAGMIQSYLHIGVEYGAPALTGFLIVILFPIVAGATLARPPSRGYCAGSNLAGTTIASIAVIWGIGNGFSTLWIVRDLWLLPGLAILAALIGIARWPRSFRKTGQTSANSHEDARAGSSHHEGTPRTAGRVGLVTGLLSVGIVIVMLLAGNVVLHNPRVDTTTDWIILREHHDPDTGAPDIWIVYPDQAVLGDDYGRRLREWMTAHGIAEIRIPKNPSGSAIGSTPAPSPTGLLVTGKWVRLIENHGNPTRLVIIHPTNAPPENVPPTTTSVHVYLPGIDTTGTNRRWKATATREGWAVQSTGWSGTYLNTPIPPTE